MKIKTSFWLENFVLLIITKALNDSVYFFIKIFLFISMFGWIVENWLFAEMKKGGGSLEFDISFWKWKEKVLGLNIFQK